MTYDLATAIARATKAGRQDVVDWLKADVDAYDEEVRLKRLEPIVVEGVGEMTPDGVTLYNVTLSSRFGRTRRVATQHRVTVRRGSWGWLQLAHPSGSRRNVYNLDEIVGIERVP